SMRVVDERRGASAPRLSSVRLARCSASWNTGERLLAPEDGSRVGVARGRVVDHDSEGVLAKVVAQLAGLLVERPDVRDGSFGSVGQIGPVAKERVPMLGRH